MEQSELKEVADRHIAPIRDLLCLGHWRITPAYESIDKGGVAAQCYADANYDHAKIVFDAAKIEADEEKIVELIFHELSHVVLSPLDLVGNLALSMLEGNTAACAAIQVIHEHACEQAVINLERIWRCGLARVYLEKVTRPD
jgi:hypothetical protein